MSADFGVSLELMCLLHIFSPAVGPGGKALTFEGYQTLIRRCETKKPLVGSAVEIWGWFVEAVNANGPAAHSTTIISTYGGQVTCS